MEPQSFRILLADDETSIRFVVSTLLKRRGNSVTVATDGREAADAFNASPGLFDLLITDHSMPVMGGLELVRHLRESGFNGRVIVISGSLTPAVEADYRRLGIDAILQKPFTVESFSSALDDLLGRWKNAA